MKSRAAILFESGKPLEICSVDVQDPKAGEVRIEIKLPDGVKAREVDVVVSGDAWSVEAGAWSLGGELMGAVRADDTAWVVDEGVLYITLTKRAGTWWPGLTR